MRYLLIILLFTGCALEQAPITPAVPIHPNKDCLLPDGCHLFGFSRIFLEVDHEDFDAYLVYDGHIQVWLPKSEVIRISDDEFFVPDWLIEQEGLTKN